MISYMELVLASYIEPDVSKTQIKLYTGSGTDVISTKH